MRALVIVLSAIVSACAPLVPTDEAQETEDLSWHSCRFAVHWPEKEPPAMHVDLFLARDIVKPVLESHGPRIPLWRFHRRAVRDAAGHRFSFIYFTDPRTQASLVYDLQNSVAFKQAGSHNIIDSLSCSDVDYWAGSDIGATADPRWSEPVRDNWPHYIMGVSKLWLGLIDDLATDSSKHGSLAETLDHYRHVDNTLIGIWHEQGEHAFLHHMDAIFGYRGFED
jgi:hypothetical protein